jgi:hypothetical protein
MELPSDDDDGDDDDGDDDAPFCRMVKSNAKQGSLKIWHTFSLDLHALLGYCRTNFGWEETIPPVINLQTRSSLLLWLFCSLSK